MLKYFCLFSLFFLNACKSDYQIAEPNLTTLATKNARLVTDNGTLVEIVYLGQKLIVNKKNGFYCYSSDQVIPSELVTSESPVLSQKMAMQYSGVYGKYRMIPWPDNVVNYVFEGGLGVQALGSKVDKAVAEWNSKNTYIKFQRYTGSQSNIATHPTSGILVFDLSSTNTSNATFGLGYPGKNRVNLRVTLTPNVTTNTILHEMMHVVGVSHEHQRGIRDKYIEIDQSKASIYGYSPTELITDILNTSDRYIFNDYKVDNFSFDYNSITIYELPKLMYSRNASKPISRNYTLTEKDINVVRTISNCNQPAELRLRSINYSTLEIPIYFDGGKKNVVFLSVGKDLVFNYDPDKKRYTFNGLPVDYVDLNNGGSSDDLKFNSYSNRITYKPNKSGDYWIINNYNNRIVDDNKYSPPFNQEVTNFEDLDGIAGKGAALLSVYSVNPNESYTFQTYIAISKK